MDIAMCDKYKIEYGYPVCLQLGNFILASGDSEAHKLVIIHWYVFTTKTNNSDSSNQSLWAACPKWV